MEAYDISNTSGVESVGSMVVYEDGSQSAAITASLRYVLSRAPMIMRPWKRCLHAVSPMEYRKVKTYVKRERIFPMEVLPAFRI